MHVHLVFVTKYRRKIFETRHIETLSALFSGVCIKFGAELKECNGERDHVHLLVVYPPSVSVSGLVNSLKGASSRVLRKRHTELKAHYWKSVLWSPSYFAASCGGAPLSVIQEYIRSQDTP